MSEFPHWLYAEDGRQYLAQSQADEDALTGLWFESPAAFDVITAPSVEQSIGMVPAPEWGPIAVKPPPLPETPPA